MIGSGLRWPPIVGASGAKLVAAANKDPFAVFTLFEPARRRYR
jgi:hypothetical protein